MTPQEHIEKAEEWADKAGQSDPHVSDLTAGHRRGMAALHAQIAQAQITLERSNREEFLLTSR